MYSLKKLSLAVALLGGFATYAHAVAVLTLSDGVNPIVIVNDNNLGVGATTADGNPSTRRLIVQRHNRQLEHQRSGRHHSTR